MCSEATLRWPSACGAKRLSASRLAAGRPVLARPDTWAYRATRFARRHRLAFGAAAVVLVLVSGRGDLVVVLAGRQIDPIVAAPAGGGLAGRRACLLLRTLGPGKQLDDGLTDLLQLRSQLLKDLGSDAGDAVRWPLDVRVNGAAAPVVERGGGPAVKVSSGQHQVQGRFAWKRRQTMKTKPVCCV